jgi:hypothetical protein
VQFKENVLYHEAGHALLARLHGVPIAETPKPGNYFANVLTHSSAYAIEATRNHKAGMMFPRRRLRRTKAQLLWRRAFLFAPTKGSANYDTTGAGAKRRDDELQGGSDVRAVCAVRRGIVEDIPAIPKVGGPGRGKNISPAKGNCFRREEATGVKRTRACAVPTPPMGV